MNKLEVYQANSIILENVVTNLSKEKMVPLPPKNLYHYSTLEVIQKIIEFDDVRLSHAEYSNDQMELGEARSLIEKRLSSPNNSFEQLVKNAFLQRIDQVDAYIFCMTSGLASNPKPQDMLSQWRAYAQDGRGGALTLQWSGVAALAYHLPGLRINPVIYEPAVQNRFIDRILVEGALQHASSKGIGTVAIDATVEALVFALPLFKHSGFSEEREWRLIFMPIANEKLTSPKVKFQPRREFLAPFLELRSLWQNIRPELIEILGEEHNPPRNVPEPSSSNLLPIVGLMVGPSGHQQLNVRAMNKAVSQSSRSFPVDFSTTPYRSLA